MSEVVETKVIKIGTSLGVLIPKKIIKENKIRLGEKVEVSILKRRKIAEIEKAFGMFKGARPFKREYEPDRV